MILYARRPWRLAGQLATDIGVGVWVVVWGLLGRFTFHRVRDLVEPVRQAAQGAGQLSGQLSRAADQAAGVPGVGGQLSQRLDAAAETVTQLLDAGDRQVAALDRLAEVLGWLVFLIPVTVVLAWWLPRRIAFVVRARSAQGFLDSGADLDLFALRALANQPLHVLARISDDPVAAWRTGDATVIHKLADVELRRSGLRMPVTDLAASAEGEKRRTP
jgi:hypothetical protein